MPRRKCNISKDLQSKRKTNVIDAAGELSIDPQTFRRYIREGCPADKVGKSYLVYVPEAAKWMAENGKSGLPGIHAEDIRASESPTLEAVRIRKETALSERYEIQTAKEKGHLIPVDAVQQWLVRNLISARNHLLGLPAKIVVAIAGRDAAEQQAIIEQFIRESLEVTANLADRLEHGLEST